MTEPASPVVIDLALWVGAPGAEAGLCVADRLEPLELLDERLAEERALLCRAEALLHDLLQGLQEASASFVAGELNLLGDQLSDLSEDLDDARQNLRLLRRAAVLCAGQDWSGLAGLVPSLRLRVAGVDEAIADAAVRLARLSRSGPRLALAPTPELLEIEAEERLVNDGLRQRAALAGAHSAFAAADAAFLPSLADFLR